MKLILTKRAERNFISIKEYIISEFGDKVAEAFEQNVVDFFETFDGFPPNGSDPNPK